MKIRLQKSQPTNEEYLMIGVSSSLKDYQLSYYLNKHFQTLFHKLADIPFYDKKGFMGDFAFFHYYDEDLRMDYFLFANKCNSTIAIPKYRHFEFFILFRLSSFLIPIKDILHEMRKIHGISAALQIPLEKFKNLNDLLEDIELHLLKISPKQQNTINEQWLWIKTPPQNAETDY